MKLFFIGVNSMGNRQVEPVITLDRPETSMVSTILNVDFFSLGSNCCDLLSQDKFRNVLIKFYGFMEHLRTCHLVQSTRTREQYIVERGSGEISNSRIQLHQTMIKSTIVLLSIHRHFRPRWINRTFQFLLTPMGRTR